MTSLTCHSVQLQPSKMHYQVWCNRWSGMAWYISACCKIGSTGFLSFVFCMRAVKSWCIVSQHTGVLGTGIRYRCSHHSSHSVYMLAVPVLHLLHLKDELLGESYNTSAGQVLDGAGWMTCTIATTVPWTFYMDVTVMNWPCYNNSFKEMIAHVSQ